MNTILPFDEIDRLKATLPMYFENGKIRDKAACEDIIDEMLDIFLLSYALGSADANSQMSSNISPTMDDITDTIDKKVAGKTWKERVRDYYESGGTEDDIIRIATTEAHRDSNEAAWKTARQAGATQKKWHCMMLPTSRDTHIYLDGVTAPIDGEFYSYKGGSTKFPGQWGIAEEDCNCCCYCTFK